LKPFSIFSVLSSGRIRAIQREKALSVVAGKGARLSAGWGEKKRETTSRSSMKVVVFQESHLEKNRS